MESGQRLFILATLESMEASFNANLKALRALIALQQHQSYTQVAEKKITEDEIRKIEDEFEKSIFSIEGLTNE